MDMAFWAGVMTSMLALLLSLAFHESAHAFIAKLQGDDTAQREGRLTLNPVAHIDPVGTLLFPFIGAIMGAAIFGWAKPVPIDTRNFKNPKWGHVLVAAAGPASNLLLCLVCIVALALYQLHFTAVIPEGHFLYPLVKLAVSMVWINAILAIFNLLPFVPLDGGTVFTAFLPDRLREMYDDFVAPYGMFILLAILFSGGFQWIGQVAAGYVNFAQTMVALAL